MGDWNASSFASISARIAAGSGADSMTARYAASTPPAMGRDPHCADGHANRWNAREPLRCDSAAMPNALRTMTAHHGTVDWRIAASACVP